MEQAARSADVVVIGGGVMGAACADALSADGMSVILVERFGLSAGATSSCQSGIGYGLGMDDEELSYYLAATRAYQTLAEEVGDIDYERTGALVVPDPGTEADMAREVEELRARGVPAEWLTGKDLREAEPALDPEVAGCAYLPEVGQVLPMKVVAALVRRAVGRGVKVLTGTAAVAVEVDRGRARSVETIDGKIAAEWIVIAAGAWSREVGELAGLRIPVWPLKGHVIVTEPAGSLLHHYVSEARYAATVEAMKQTEISESGPLHGPAVVASVLQPLPSGQILIGSSRQFAGFDRSVQRETLAEIGHRARALVPALDAIRVLRTYAGLRPWTTDGQPLIGPTQQLPGIAIVTGHGGEGNTGALISARILADLMGGREPAVDAGRFSPDRFVLN
jgi:sarcosine oxidase subunit beta